MDSSIKVRENRLRRMAQRQGLQLVKSKRRDPRALDYGTYSLASIDTNTLVYGGDTATGGHVYLDDIEAYLTQ